MTHEVDATTPFMPIFGRHPATRAGGGALPTAEAGILRVMASMSSADDALIDGPTAAAMRILLTAPDTSMAEPVEDVSHALALMEHSLDQFLGPDRDTEWFRSAATILAGLKSEIATIDKALASLERDNLSPSLRTQLSQKVRLAVPALLSGRDMSGDERIDAKVDLAGLLQLRDTLGYPAVVDGEDWNCRPLPASLEAELAVYRQDILWCGRRATADGISQS
jgi:hypothetical protein